MKAALLGIRTRTFRHWESPWAFTFMADMCFEYTDYGSDGTGD